jgi:MFS family permease
MAVLGVSSITPVLPNVATVFDRTPQSVAWVIAMFTLPGVLFTPIAGVLGDRIGRKVVLIPSLILFAVAGTACGLVRSFEALLALRFLQGIGATALGAINITLIGDLFHEQRRADAMGYNAAVLSVGTGVYPAIGGGLAIFAWYYPFFLPIVSLPVALAVLFLLDNPEPQVKGSLREYMAVTLRSVLQSQVLLLFSISVVTFILIYGPFLAYLPFLLVGSFGSSPVLIGVVMSVTSVSTAIASLLLGALSRRFGVHSLVRFSFILYAVSLAGMPLATSLPKLLIPIVIFGAANGLNIPGFLTILTGYAPIEYRAAFMSMNGMLLRLGQTLGPVLAGIVVAVVGIEGSFYAGALLALAMFVVLAMWLRGEPARR